MVSEEKNFLEKRLGAKEKLIKGNGEAMLARRGWQVWPVTEIKRRGWRGES